ncbi:hypothetical protein BESB_001520 [Besnoitia besnoiti]|uniref:Protein kinase domain-containing protein n=1 Tax=Besnoitia besnoiti TaxID=94643 RepID=A0A2A9MPN0_BESBE|nr:hypothetical protein BESB_001520 [Besnoitia besnoiti]PFH37810.1 hypothetical protein BESB_001520 [Besnoitia besnoiti]
MMVTLSTWSTLCVLLFSSARGSAYGGTPARRSEAAQPTESRERPLLPHFGSSHALIQISPHIPSQGGPEPYKSTDSAQSSESEAAERAMHSAASNGGGNGHAAIHGREETSLQRKDRTESGTEATLLSRHGSQRLLKFARRVRDLAGELIIPIPGAHFTRKLSQRKTSSSPRRPEATLEGRESPFGHLSPPLLNAMTNEPLSQQQGAPSPDAGWRITEPLRDLVARLASSLPLGHKARFSVPASRHLSTKADASLEESAGDSRGPANSSWSRPPNSKALGVEHASPGRHTDRQSQKRPASGRERGRWVPTPSSIRSSSGRFTPTKRRSTRTYKRMPSAATRGLDGKNSRGCLRATSPSVPPSSIGSTMSLRLPRESVHDVFSPLYFISPPSTPDALQPPADGAPPPRAPVPAPPRVEWGREIEGPSFFIPEASNWPGEEQVGAAATAAAHNSEGVRLQRAAIQTLAVPAKPELANALRAQVRAWRESGVAKRCTHQRRHPVETAIQLVFPEGMALKAVDSQGQSVGLVSGGYVCHGSFGVIIKVVTESAEAFAAKIPYGMVHDEDSKTPQEKEAAIQAEKKKIWGIVDEEITTRERLLATGYSVAQLRRYFRLVVTVAVLTVNQAVSLEVHADKATVLLSSVLLIQPLLGPSMRDLLPAAADHRVQLAAARGMVLAVAGAHRLGFTHGDVRLSNFVLDDKGEVLLVDLSTAKPLRSCLDPGEKIYVAHCSPEAAQAILNFSSFDAVLRGSFDVWQLGASLFEFACEKSLPYTMSGLHFPTLEKRLLSLAAVQHTEFSVWYCPYFDQTVMGIAFMFLNPKPEMRPVLSQFVAHPFFSEWLPVEEH